MLAYLENLHFAIFSICFKNAIAFSSYMHTLEMTYFPIKTFPANYDNHLVLFRAASDWVEVNVFNTPGVSVILNLAHDYISAPMLLLSTLYLFLLFILGLFTAARFIVSLRLFTFSLTIAEQEFATPRAIALLMSLILCLLLTTVGGAIFGSSLTTLRMLYLTSIGLLLYLVALLPINLMYNWGAYFPIYIKGQSIKKNIFVELMTDYIHLLSFFLRINIQLIRLVIITCVFYMYNEMYVEFIYPTLNSSTPHAGFLGYIYTGAAFALKLTANLLYEVGHLWVMVGMQSGAFMMIIFVITQFLYSVYLLHRLQPFLLNLRSKKN